MNTILQGVGVDNSRLLGLAERLGLPLRGESDGFVPDRVVVLWNRAESERSFAWFPPDTCWIEAAAMADDAIVEIIRRGLAYELFASLTTTTANDLRIAEDLVSAVSALRSIDDSRRQDIALALHEAVSNAIIHGNLRIDGLKALSVDDLDLFSRQLAERLGDPTFAHRRVEIRVSVRPDAFTVEVVDEGNGYTFNCLTGKGATKAASGRGLELIGTIARRYQPLDDGRRLRMEFEW